MHEPRPPYGCSQIRRGTDVGNVQPTLPVVTSDRLKACGSRPPAQASGRRIGGRSGSLYLNDLGHKR